jgi:hypothetical protein
VVNMFSDDSPENIVDLLLSHRPDGIIYTTMGLRQVPVPAKLLTLPCVLANCESLNDPVASYIPDDEQGQYVAVKALLAAGYRNPLCLHLPANHLATVRRRQGLERACREAGIDPDTLVHSYMARAMSTTMISPPWCWPSPRGKAAIRLGYLRQRSYRVYGLSDAAGAGIADSAGRGGGGLRQYGGHWRSVFTAALDGAAAAL